MKENKIFKTPSKKELFSGTEMQRLFDISELVKGQRQVFDELYNLVSQQKIFKDLNPQLFHRIDSELIILKNHWGNKYLEVMESLKKKSLPWAKRSDVQRGNCYSLNLGNHQMIEISDWKQNSGPFLGSQEIRIDLIIESPSATAIFQPINRGKSGSLLEDLNLRSFLREKCINGHNQTDELLIGEQVGRRLYGQEFDVVTLLVNGTRTIEPEKKDENNTWISKNIDTFPPLKTEKSFRIITCCSSGDLGPYRKSQVRLIGK